MFIKIFCGDSQKYLLLQSNNVTLNKKKEMLNSDLYPILCAYLDVIQEPVETHNFNKQHYLCDVWKQMHDIRKEQESEVRSYPCIEEVICDTVPNTPYELIVPVLSDSQEAEKINLLSENPGTLDAPASACNEEISVVQIDEKTYITTGPIFVMNDDGKTIDRV